MKIYYSILALTISVLAVACSSDDPDPLPDLTPQVELASISNGGFEQNLDGWTIDGDATAAQISSSACEGSNALLLGAATAHTVSVSQTATGIDDGLYDLEFFYKNTGTGAICYITAGNNNKMTALAPSASTWARGYIRGVKVEGSACHISIKAEADSEAWVSIDGLQLIRSDREFTLLRGGDISELSYVEDGGGKYYLDGEQRDCIDILKEGGFNVVRLRLYNDPGNASYSPSNRLPAGYQDADDVLQLAKRAKDAGMQIVLTFHYSDYWTNGDTQTKPHEWEDLDFAQLKQKLYDFTYDFLQRMKAQGTMPEYVALGNETQSGMLYPDGSYENFAQLVELYNAGYDAVKAVDETSKVIIHLNAAGSNDLYNWYLGELADRNCKYDIIGASYYPYWTQMSASQIRVWADYIAEKFGKDIMLMETGYSWSRTLPDGTAGQLSDNGPYTDFSPMGQKNFLLELISEIKKSDGCHILGLLYWDPVFIETTGLGWELGADNIVSNSTLFDFSGNALESFNAFKYNN